ncbi:hypothetical protein ACOJQI_05595 [Bacillus salacetis]|uniref:hypothetical protein n=1 Tax=Bacillus salacetis TaxID=2315464 RepID=UPI003BA25B7E
MKLILVEGIPGARKTSACEYIENQLHDAGVNARVYGEGDLNHPIDYESTAFVSYERLDDLKTTFPELEKLRDSYHHNGCYQGVLIPYGTLASTGMVTEECAAELSKYDVYEMSSGVYKELVLSKWKTFAAQAEKSDSIVITDCCFLQNPLTMLMAKCNESPESIMEFVLDIEQIIAGLDSLLFYLAPDSVRDVIEDVRSSRSSEWFQHVSSYYTEQEYGRAHALPGGVEGVVQLLEERMALEKQIISHLKMQTYIIPVSVKRRERAGEELDVVIKKVSSIMKELKNQSE